MSTIRQFALGPPKGVLYLHLEGTLEPGLEFELAHDEQPVEAVDTYLASWQ